MMPVEIDLGQDLKLFTSFFNNPVIVSVTFGVVFGYLFLVFLAHKKDKTDVEKVWFI